MPIKNKIYKISITDDGIDNYKTSNTSAKDMAENLGVDAVMTDFEWDEDLNKGIILTGRIVDDMSVEDALSELLNVEYVAGVKES
ncbi:hypothetical protein [Clostridium sp.]|uniref:hypothetical protein n=1 Tax=Clostridium sp. TaxID=1506 RepID=UPI001A395B71|nr:hypothetical protein [Clostridium sp.]MBK5241344.1 hypothetical protein [Clostridium sp.]